MKRTIFFFIIALIIGNTLQSCDLETSSNGDLDGLWHLVRVDTLGLSGSDHTLDLSGERLYWAFQNDLMQTQDASTGELYIYRFSHEGDSLIVSEPRVNDRDVSDSLITDVTLLQPFGINTIPESFYVSQLSGSSMVLQSKSLQLSLKKF